MYCFNPSAAVLDDGLAKCRDDLFPLDSDFSNPLLPSQQGDQCCGAATLDVAQVHPGHNAPIRLEHRTRDFRDAQAAVVPLVAVGGRKDAMLARARSGKDRSDGGGGGGACTCALSSSRAIFVGVRRAVSSAGGSV